MRLSTIEGGHREGQPRGKTLIYPETPWPSFTNCPFSDNALICIDHPVSSFLGEFKIGETGNIIFC